MTDKSELKLAEGSRWDLDCVVDTDGTEVVCGVTDGVLSLEFHRIEYSIRANLVDALAAIRAVDGDPEYLELKRLRAENEALVARCDELQRERDDLADQIRAGYGG